MAQPNLVSVDYDPFTTSNDNSPKLVPVEHNPFDTEANKGAVEKAFDALRYGVEQTAAGASKTIGGPRAPLGATPYTPASEGLHDTSKGVLDRAGYLPRAIVESLPGGVQDALAGAGAGALGGAVAGPVGAILGGGAGAIGSYGLRNYGNDIEEAAKAAGEDPNNPSRWTQAKAIASSMAGGVLSRLGLRTGLGTATKAVGAQVIPQVASSIAKSAGANAGLSAAQTAQHEALINGQTLSLDTLATDALTGGVIGGGLRSIKAPGELTQAYKFKDFGPEFNSVAERFSGLDTNTPKESFKAVKSVEDRLKNEVQTQSDTKSHISTLEKQPGYDLDINKKLNGIRGKLKAGDVVDPGDIAEVGDTLGKFRQGGDLIASLEDYNNLNRMKLIGKYGKGTFGGGISETGVAKALLTPHLTSFPVGAGLGYGLTHWGLSSLGLGGVVAGALGVPIVQAGLRSATRGVDALMGNRNPLEQFTGRFGGDVPVRPALPNFRDTLAEQKQAEGVSRSLEKGIAKAATENVRQSQASPTTQAATETGSPSAQGATKTEGLGPSAEPTFSVTHEGQTVTRSTEGVRKLPHVSAKIQSAMEERANSIQAAHQALRKLKGSPEEHQAMDELGAELNLGSGMESKTVANAAIDKHISRLPPEHQMIIKNVLRKHILLAFHKKD